MKCCWNVTSQRNLSAQPQLSELYLLMYAFMQGPKQSVWIIEVWILYMDEMTKCTIAIVLQLNEAAVYSILV